MGEHVNHKALKKETYTHIKLIYSSMRSSCLFILIIRFVHHARCKVVRKSNGGFFSMKHRVVNKADSGFFVGIKIFIAHKNIEALLIG